MIGPPPISRPTRSNATNTTAFYLIHLHLNQRLRHLQSTYTQLAIDSEFMVSPGGVFFTNSTGRSYMSGCELRKRMDQTLIRSDWRLTPDFLLLVRDGQPQH